MQITNYLPLASSPELVDRLASVAYAAQDNNQGDFDAYMDSLMQAVCTQIDKEEVSAAERDGLIMRMFLGASMTINCTVSPNESNEHFLNEVTNQSTSKNLRFKRILFKAIPLVSLHLTEDTGRIDMELSELSEKVSAIDALKLN